MADSVEIYVLCWFSKTMIFNSYIFHVQEFYPVMSTIFTGFKNPDPDLRIPLLFMENDDDVQRWIQIDRDFLMGKLPDGNGPKSKSRRKPLSYSDYKPLYGLRNEDINYLVEQVENAMVCMKKTTLNVDDFG
jgi:hypothetical protein